MGNPESILKNKTRNVFLSFDILADHLISARQPDLMIVNKKLWTCLIGDIILLADPY